MESTMPFLMASKGLRCYYTVVQQVLSMMIQAQRNYMWYTVHKIKQRELSRQIYIQNRFKPVTKYLAGDIKMEMGGDLYFYLHQSANILSLQKCSSTFESYSILIRIHFMLFLQSVLGKQVISLLFQIPNMLFKTTYAPLMF